MTTMEMVYASIEDLTGQVVPFENNKSKLINHEPFRDTGMGHSQLNELLLTLGYDRITESFFRYLFDNNSAVQSYSEFAAGATKFKKHAMLMYGNVKFGFKKLSSLDEPELGNLLSYVRPIEAETYRKRHKILHKIKEIPAEDAYYLGYLIERETREKLAKDPTNEALIAQSDKIKAVQEVGRSNHDIYLTYDHMDVYIATSMREKHEFHVVRDFIKKLFYRDELRPLNLRWFDPTQAYCRDRIDKGLVEGLMVKRAKCTIYHVQEADTLGKDSELAATLAQGKPVIAFIPQLTNQEEFESYVRLAASQLYSDMSFKDLILGKFLPLYYPDGAWKDPLIQSWLSGNAFNEKKACEILFNKAKAMYDRRSATLRESHPLGLQVNLDTGVSNGVLVVRSLRDCAALLRNIMLNTMEFDLEKHEEDGRVAWHLREKISQCIYRVVTGDDLLTNSFWNFYLKTPSLIGLSKT